jgi:hypothetical protein
MPAGGTFCMVNVNLKSFIVQSELPLNCSHTISILMSYSLDMGGLGVDVWLTYQST